MKNKIIRDIVRSTREDPELWLYNSKNISFYNESSGIYFELFEDRLSIYVFTIHSADCIKKTNIFQRWYLIYHMRKFAKLKLSSHDYNSEYTMPIHPRRISDRFLETYEVAIRSRNPEYFI